MSRTPLRANGVSGSPDRDKARGSGGLPRRWQSLSSDADQVFEWQASCGLLCDYPPISRLTRSIGPLTSAGSQKRPAEPWRSQYSVTSLANSHAYSLSFNR